MPHAHLISDQARNEFLPNFALENNGRLPYMRLFQKWYLVAFELGLPGVPFAYSHSEVFAVEGVQSQKMTISFEDIQFLYRQKRLDINQLTVWCL